MRNHRSAALPIALVALGLTACGISVNGPIEIADGETRSGGASTVNGSISVGHNATVEGGCRTVNGNIDVGREARVEQLQAVNGSIRVDDDSLVDGDIEAVNGSISLRADARVNGRIRTVNGAVEARQARIVQGISTVNGDVRLVDHSVVEGDIVVEKKMGADLRSRPLEIELSGGSEVLGNIINENPDVEVRVRLLDGSKVSGRVENAEVIEG
jgi:hypothetical protein